MDGQLAQLVAPLVADPARSAVVCDIDGTLAPIVARPDQAQVPEATVELLARLAGRYALVGCVTGRSAADARQLVPPEQVGLAGNHGLELWRDGRVQVEPEAAEFLPAVRQAVVLVENDGPLLEDHCTVEDKGITFSVHYRNSPRPDHVLRYLETQIVPKIERAGLQPNFGRMVLEVRPPVALNKGTGLRALRGVRDIQHTLFVGDDRSDLDAFAEATIKIAVRSPEAPPELLAAADAVVSGPPAVAELLAYLCE